MEKQREKGFYSMIGEGGRFEGTVAVPHSMRIDGAFKGKIESAEMLTIGNNGLVEADIKAKSVIIGGRVTGTIVAEERIELESHAVHRGDMRTP